MNGNEMRNGKTIFDLPLRVTFYVRISTNKDEQINSLEIKCSTTHNSFRKGEIGPISRVMWICKTAF